MIQEQVRLPLRIAAGVVMQGIRIRFGRSLVTVLGIVLGIAFLMANLMGQIIKEGVREEDALRTEVRRMASFLAAEMGPPTDRSIGVIQLGALNEAETRLLEHLSAAGLREVRWFTAAPGRNLPPPPVTHTVTEAISGVGEGVNSVLVIGSNVLPDELGKAEDVDRLFARAYGKVLAFTRSDLSIAAGPDTSIVALMRDRRPEEIAAAAAEARKARFRMNWIVVISLLVTVTGIANAMLMSVTERFREIGTMKCLGAPSSFIRRMFLVESSVMGAAGAAAGAFSGAFFSVMVYGFTYGFGMVLTSLDLGQLASYLLLSVAAGIVLSIAAAVYPASVASAMGAADALRSSV